MRLRKVVFWLHLSAGVTAGAVIFVMSVTGVLLAFERQITAFAERDVRTVQPPASGASRLGLEVLMTKARAAVPEGTASGVTVSADPAMATMVSFGREQVVFVDPFTGAVLGTGATALRGIFHAVTDWHRWLGRHEESRDIGRAITGACNAAFGVLVITGFYLWWPRRWTRVALKAVMVPSRKLRGKPRDWNWHNSIGFWSAPVLLFITLTGLVISYQWAGNLIYTLTGSEAPPQRPSPGQPAVAAGRPSRPAPATMGGRVRAEEGSSVEGRGRSGEAAEGHFTPPLASMDALFAAAERQAPHWRLITMRLPLSGASQMAVMIEEAAALHPYPRSTLTLNAATAAVVRWEPYAGYNLGRTIRLWVRPVHTGEAGGILGQLIAALASAGGAVLVWTGLALAWRRFFGRTSRAAAANVEVESASRGVAPFEDRGSASRV